MITIKEIAKQLGVSPTTVSNVLNGRTGKMSPETRQKVQEALVQNHYVHESRHGDDEHIVFSRAAHGDERLESAFGVLPQSCRHFLARERAALVGMHLVLCARPF